MKVVPANEKNPVVKESGRSLYCYSNRECGRHSSATHYICREGPIISLKSRAEEAPDLEAVLEGLATIRTRALQSLLSDWDPGLGGPTFTLQKEL